MSEFSRQGRFVAIYILFGFAFSLQVVDAIFPGDEQIGGEADEQSVFNNSGASFEQRGKLFGLREFIKFAVEYKVALVGFEKGSVILPARAHSSSERFQIFRLGAPGEGYDLYR